MDEDKRDAERIAILGDLQAEIMVFEPMLIKEISRSGVTAETAFALHLNSLHDLRLSLGGRSIVVKGRVVHSRISDVDQDVVLYKAGVEFVEPVERIASVITDFIDAVRAGRRAL